MIFHVRPPIEMSPQMIFGSSTNIDADKEVGVIEGNCFWSFIDDAANRYLDADV